MPFFEEGYKVNYAMLIKDVGVSYWLMCSNIKDVFLVLPFY
jgi:hypothetical protein